MIPLLAVNSIIIKLEGITAHAGEPERDQSMAIASLLPNSIFFLALTFKEIIALFHSIYM
jgi:hypothetical protein